MDERLAELAARQAGLVARRQLAGCGVSWEQARSRLGSGRWLARTPRVLSTTTGELTPRQRRWLGVLHAGPDSLLGHLTAAAELGLTRWDRDTVTVLTGDLHPGRVEGVDFVRTRRPLASLASTRPGVATARLEPAVLLWAAYAAPTPRAAHGVVAATLQQRLTTPQRLQDALAALRPLRGGAALARAVEQAADGRVLVLEVEGGHHDDPLQTTADARRSRRLTSSTRLVVRCTAYELAHEGDEVAADLIALGVPQRPRQGRG